MQSTITTEQEYDTAIMDLFELYAKRDIVKQQGIKEHYTNRILSLENATREFEAEHFGHTFMVPGSHEVVESTEVLSIDEIHNILNGKG